MRVKDQLNQWAKSAYMSLVKLKSKRARRQDRCQGVAYLLSFQGNDRGLIERLSQEKELGTVTVYYTKACETEVEIYRDRGLACYNLDETSSFFKECIARISNARYIICDNYFAFMGALELSDETTVFQIWHANGAIKTFGWQDKATASRTKADHKRFQAVYEACDYYVVGSDKMGDVFKDSYQISETKMLKTGCPRTDYYFKEGRNVQAQEKFHRAFPDVEEKRVVLYVPTYRPYETSEIEAMLSQLSLPEGTIGFGHLHPHMTEYRTDGPLNFDLRGLTLEELLYNVDILITDYSSVPFDYSLIKPEGRLVFYCPDLEIYEQQVGLQPEFVQETGSGIVQTVEHLQQKLERDDGLLAADYGASWQEYNDGQASERLIDFMKTK